MSRWDRFLIGLAAWAISCASCAPRQVVPYVLRPDTREIWGIHLDSAAFMGTLAILQAALPNEAAVCYHGTLVDTVLTRPDSSHEVVRMILVDSVSPAVSDSVDQFHVFFKTARAGCAQEIAIGHSHPYAQVCDASDDDALLLFGNPHALVSIVWCASGEAQVTYQDGRHKTQRWRPE